MQRKIALFLCIIKIVPIQQKRVFKRANNLSQREEEWRTRKEDREDVQKRTASQRTLSHKLSWIEHYNKSLKIILRKSNLV